MHLNLIVKINEQIYSIKKLKFFQNVKKLRKLIEKKLRRNEEHIIKID